MSNTALAIKYRPKSFDTLIGQETISQTLSFALSNNRLSHAYLFSGLRGSGKTSTARIFAKALNCEKGPTATPCEVCDSCRNSNNNSHPDVIEMDAASNRKIDDIRDLIEHTRFAPSMGRFKIFIIDEVHMLTKEAYNALLKTLEEPPEYVKFILATTDPLKIPSTIVSRTQQFRFNKISKKATLEHLKKILEKEKIEKYEDEALELLIRNGKGSMRDTLTLLDQAISFSNNNLETSVISKMLGAVDISKIDDVFNAILSKDKDKVIKIIDDLEDFEANSILDEIISYLKDKIIQNDVRFNTFIIDRFFRILNDSKVLLNMNSDEYFVLVLTFLKMQEATKLIDIDKEIENLENSQKSNNNEPIKQTNNIQEKETTTLANENTSTNYDIQPTKIDKFTQLKVKINDRNAQLGEIFEQGVKFVSFENNILLMKSSVANENRSFLNEHFPIIKTFIQEIYNTDKIKIEKDKDINKIASNNEKMSDEAKEQAIKDALGIKNKTIIEKD